MLSNLPKAKSSKIVQINSRSQSPPNLHGVIVETALKAATIAMTVEEIAVVEAGAQGTSAIAAVTAPSATGEDNSSAAHPSPKQYAIPAAARAACSGLARRSYVIALRPAERGAAVIPARQPQNGHEARWQ